MKYSSRFLLKISTIVENQFGIHADISFSFVSTKSFEAQKRDAKKWETQILFESQCFFIVYTGCNEDVICYINKDNQWGAICFYDDATLEKNKQIRASNALFFSNLLNKSI